MIETNYYHYYYYYDYYYIYIHASGHNASITFNFCQRGFRQSYAAKFSGIVSIVSGPGVIFWLISAWAPTDVRSTDSVSQAAPSQSVNPPLPPPPTSVSRGHWMGGLRFFYGRFGRVQQKKHFSRPLNISMKVFAAIGVQVQPTLIRGERNITSWVLWE